MIECYDTQCPLHVGNTGTEDGPYCSKGECEMFPVDKKLEEIARLGKSGNAISPDRVLMPYEEFRYLFGLIRELRRENFILSAYIDAHLSRRRPSSVPPFGDFYVD